MFLSYPRDITTSQDRARPPPLEPTTFPINNGHIHEALIQPTEMEEAVQEYDFRHGLAGLKQDHLVDSHYQTAFLPTDIHSTFPGCFQQPATAESNATYMENPNYQAIPRNAAMVPDSYQSHAFKWPEAPNDLIPPTGPVGFNTSGPISSEAALQAVLYFDEVWANITGNRVETGLALQEEPQMASNRRDQKRLRTPEPALGVGPSQWMAESQDRGGLDPPNTRPTKRRRMTMERRETGVMAVAQRDKTQELHAGRTSRKTEYKSKLGNQGLRKETLAAPSQGVYPPFSLRPTTGATLGPTELEDQAWTRTEGSERVSEGTEDVHDEETGEERWSRLRVKEEKIWKCRECPRKTFFDRSTLRRHCKTVHGRECDRWKCPLCPDKSYSRKSGLDRHRKEKH